MIIDIKTNLTLKNKTKWCNNFQYTFETKSKKLLAIENKTTWILKIIFHIYIYRTTNIISIKHLKSTVKQTPYIEHFLSEAVQVINRSSRYSRIWFMVFLLLPTQHQVGGYGTFRQTSNLNLLPSSIKMLTSPLKNPYDVVESLPAYHRIQPKNQAKKLISEEGLYLHKNKPSFYNVSINTFSLINISQSKNTSYLLNKKISFKMKNRVPMQNRKFRETRDIRLDAKSQNIKPKNIDEASLKRLVLKGLGMKKIPDMSKVNISQVEYSKKYKEYLSRLRDNHEKGASYFNNHIGAYSFRDINLLSIITNKFNDISHKRWRNKRALKHLKKISQTMNEEKLQYYQRDKTNILLHFSLKNVKDAKFHYDKIDEANVRLMLLYSSSLASDFRRLKGQNKRKTSHASQTDYFLNTIKNCNSGDVSYNQSKRTQSRQLNLKVYHLLSTNRRKLLASRKIKTENIGSEETRTQWIEFDVTKAVRSWINKSHENLEIEIQCDKCKSIGARILSDSSSSQSSYVKSAAPSVEHFDIMPVLNIIGHGAPNAHEDGDSDVHHIILTNNKSDDYVHHRSNQETTWRNKWSNNCYKLHQRCCRNQLNVAFKDIKGFEFILQPKVFDAGYCQGRCPPRHNPAHHHALLQSLIWQDDHNRAPRPCCAPSKLDMLEILHVDEEHTDKLKISTWSDMQVVECACS